MLLTIFCNGPKSFAFQSVTLCFYFESFVYTLPRARTAWFTENSTIPDEYGSAPSANDWLMRHWSGAKEREALCEINLHARSREKIIINRREYSKVLRETMAKIMFNYGTIALFLKKVWNFTEILSLFQKNKKLTRKSKKKHHSIWWWWENRKRNKNDKIPRARVWTLTTDRNMVQSDALPTELRGTCQHFRLNFKVMF